MVKILEYFTSLTQNVGTFYYNLTKFQNKTRWHILATTDNRLKTWRNLITSRQNGLKIRISVSICTAPKVLKSTLYNETTKTTKFASFEAFFPNIKEICVFSVQGNKKKIINLQIKQKSMGTSLVLIFIFWLQNLEKN